MGVARDVRRAVRDAREVAREVRRVARESWAEIHEENIAFMAGSIAYYAFVSLLPLLLFSLIILSTIGNETLTAYLTDLTAAFLTPYARQLLIDSLNVGSARTGASVVGTITLLWGMSRIFRGLDVAFSEIYGSHDSKTVRDKVTNGLVVFFALAAAVAIIVVAGVAFAFLPEPPYPALLNSLFLVAGLAVAFFPIYYVFPDVEVTPLEVLPGVVFAAVGWATLEAAFQLYVAVAGRYEAAYGTLGSALLLLVWLYGSGFILLVGAVINAVLAGRTGDEHVAPITDDVSARESETGGARSPSERATPSGRPNGGRATSRGREGRAPFRTGEGLVRSRGDLRRASERLDAENRRLRERVGRLETENERLEAENERLQREKRDLTRRLARRRVPLRERAKRWLFGED